jgi:phosphoribosylformylglycinamidine cyclo-ligase
MEISEAVMSPTRHFPLIVKRLLEELGPEIHGLVLNTGGGQTKCTRVGNGIRYVKDNLPEPDPVFMLLQDASGKPWKKMHESFNMGIGLDVIVPDSACGSVRRVAEEFGVGCQQTGVCEKSDDFRNKLLIRGEFGEFLYDAE